MRTAVVRVDVDPSGLLSPEQLREGMARLTKSLDESDIRIVDNNLQAMPVGRRQAELLISGTDAAAMQRAAVEACADAFGTEAAPGVLTYVSRGTDADALGVLAGFGITGEVIRTAGDDGWDIIEVTLRKQDLTRVPESRIHTALEASLNCEVRISTI